MRGREAKSNWSGQEDLNLRPHGPEPCALTRLSYAPGVRTRRKRREKETRILGEPRSRVKPALSEVHSVHSGDNVPATVRRDSRTESPLLTSSFAPAKGDFMSKRFITLLMIVAAPLFAQQPPQNPQPFGERVDVNLVQLDAIVTDSRGNQMLGLGKDDFVVRENGQPLPVDSVDYFTNRRLIDAPQSAPNFKLERVHDERYLIFFFDKATSDFGPQTELIRARY